MRKMASIRVIDNVYPIEGADAIECAVVGGWKVVVKKGEFKAGDLAVYFEIDSWIPFEVAPFLCKGKEPREFEGVKGERLKTIKLRGQLSQGLLLPMEQKMDGGWLMPVTRRCNVREGEDVSDELNVKKWEKVIPAQLAGVCKGNFPTLIPKTDQERCQNLVAEIRAAAAEATRFEVTEKLEGSSMTCYLINGEFGVCSRNLDLKETADNAFWKTARDEGIEERMRELFGNNNVAIQGELIGPGIQGNIYKLSKPEFHVFDIYDIDSGVYLRPEFRRALVVRMGLTHVPVLSDRADIQDTLGITSIDGLLQYAEGKSALTLDYVEREGVVFKQIDGGFTFKAVSNKYLLGEK